MDVIATDGTMTVRRIGGSLGATFPKEVMERLNIGEGDKLFVVVKDGEIILTPYDPAFDQAMAIYRRGARKYRNALRELAK
jgi:putative addiction module antidote